MIGLQNPELNKAGDCICLGGIFVASGVGMCVFPWDFHDLLSWVGAPDDFGQRTALLVSSSFFIYTLFLIIIPHGWKLLW